MAIQIGVTGWGDHDSLYNDQVAAKDKLSVYGSHFPTVEVDSSFYAIQPQKNYQKWINETPNEFSFVVKAFRKMTGHDRESMSVDEAKDLFKAYRESIEPMKESGKLFALLFQFPPWFDVKKENIRKLRRIKEWYPDLPLSLEFRHQSWFSPAYRADTLRFMKEEGWIHTICDEPQSGEGSVPTVLEATSEEKTVIRFHGRNEYGWSLSGSPDWRKYRCLYRYNEKELHEWVERLEKLKQQSKEIVVLFNNNSGGDAADNAKQLIDMLGIEYQNLNPRQMDFFQF